LLLLTVVERLEGGEFRVLGALFLASFFLPEIFLQDWIGGRRGDGFLVLCSLCLAKESNLSASIFLPGTTSPSPA
jgi:hypothetical protein